VPRSERDALADESRYRGVTTMTTAIKSKFCAGDRVKFAHPFTGPRTGIVTKVKRAGVCRHGLAFDYFDVAVAFDDGDTEWLTDNNDRLSIA
jgi:hypothetical protein